MQTPGEHFAGKVLKGEDGFIYLGDFELLDHTELADLSSPGGTPTSSRLLSNAEKIAVTQHQNCVAIASRSAESKWFSNPLLLELGAGSEHTIDEWAGALRQAILLAAQFPSQDAAVAALIEASRLFKVSSALVDGDFSTLYSLLSVWNNQKRKSSGNAPRLCLISGFCESA